MDYDSKRAVCKKLIRIVKKHPQGIALNKLVKVFAQKFKRELLPAELGFHSLEAFVSSREELVMEDDMIFHKNNILVLTGTDFKFLYVNVLMYILEDMLLGQNHLLVP